MQCHCIGHSRVAIIRTAVFSEAACVRLCHHRRHLLGSIGDAKAISKGCDGIDCGPAPSPAQNSHDLAIWGAGIGILVCCQIIQAILGHSQAVFYKKFQDRAPRNQLADEYLFSAHVLSLLMIVGLWKDIAHSARLAFATPPISAFLPLPQGMVWLLLNNASQLVCIKGVFRLSAHYNPLTVNITLSVRKFLSVMFSIVWFGNAWTSLHSASTLAIFGGVFAYSQCAAPPALALEEKKKD